MSAALMDRLFAQAALQFEPDSAALTADGILFVDRLDADTRKQDRKSTRLNSSH